MTVTTVIPLAATEHRAPDVILSLTALLRDREIFLRSEEFVQVRQRESVPLVVLFAKKPQIKATISSQCIGKYIEASL